MAARKTRQPPAHERDVPSDVSTPPADTEPPPPPARRSLLALAVVAFALWFAALTMLAISTANPVTLNRAQVRQSDLIVEATVEDPKQGQCSVLQNWPAGDVGDSITVLGLEEVAATAGETYLMPLQRQDQGSGFEIMPTAPPESQRLIYPATDESRRQLTEIFENRTSRPADQSGE